MYLTLLNTLHSTFFTLALMSGIVLCAYAPSFYTTPMILIAFYVASLCIYILHTYIHNNYLTTRAIISFGILLLGGYAYHYQQKNHGTLHTLSGNNPFDIIGTVTNIRPVQQGYSKQRLTIDMSAIRKIAQNTEHNNDWQQINKSIYLYSTQIMDAQVGDTIELSKLIIKPPKRDSYNTYLMKEKIDASIFAQTPEWKLVDRPHYSLQRYMFDATFNLSTALQKKLSKGAFSLFHHCF